jgi:gamma-glutamylputrescine oxidase
VGLATLAGRLISEAISGDAQRFDIMSTANPPAFPGLSLVRRPLLSLAMRWFAFRDRFQR